MNNSNRVIFNTLVLYGRMAITLFITLFSTRWILKALGEQDYGIYNVIAGIVAMLSLLNNVMSNSIQRFLSYALGCNDIKLLKKVFYYSIILFMCIGIILFIGIQGIGLYIIDNVLEIPESRIEAAKFVLTALSFNVIISVLSSPYGASISAHEKMLYFSVINIIQSLIKFFIAYILLYYTHDRLKLYSVLLILVSLVFFSGTFIYCTKNFSEVKFKFEKIKDKQLFKQICSFSSMKLLATSSNMIRIQGLDVIINTFGGIIANAAYGIALQINGQTAFLSNALLNAIRPQIVKNESMGQRNRTILLSYTACKFSFILLSLIIIPFIIEMPYILQIWLHKVPDYTVIFCQQILIFTLFQQIFMGITDGIESAGKVNRLQISTTLFHLSSLTISYLLMNNGLPVNKVLYIIIIEEILLGFVILFIAKNSIGINIKKFITDIFFPCIFILCISYYILTFCKYVITINSLRLIIEILVNSIFIISTSWFFVCTNFEKERIQKAQKYFFNYIKSQF